ncbi:MAG: prepilin peptidase [Deltaproteobacteria bacterium]|nr:prepilin peptidase [Deltaproteobacteria bacterium]
MEWINLFRALVTFGFGALVGSFLNVCITRLPQEDSKERSILWPRSHCDHCQKQLPWVDLIPLVSTILLLGRCRFCKAKISFEYFIVELVTAFLAVWTFDQFGFRPQGFAYFLFVASLVVITAIDIHHRIIPDVISLGGTLLGFLLSLHFLDINYTESLLGILSGGGFLLLLAWTYFKFTSREGMGGGDIKLAAMIGAFLGYKSILLVLFLSSILGSVWGLFMILLKKENLRAALPFGPFLAGAALITLFYGELILYFLGYS